MNLNTWQIAIRRAEHIRKTLTDATTELMAGNFDEAATLFRDVQDYAESCHHDVKCLKQERESDMVDAVKLALYALKAPVDNRPKFRTRMAAADCADLQYDFPYAANRYRSTLLLEHPGSEELKPHDTGAFRITGFIGNRFWYGGVLAQEVEIEFVCPEQIDVLSVRQVSYTEKQIHWRSL